MELNTVIPVDFTPLAPVVSLLERAVDLKIDPEPLQTLFALKGEVAAEETIVRVLEDITARVSTFDGLVQRSAFAEIDAPAVRVSVIARQIGLVELADAANHLATSARQFDGIALEATKARLDRALACAVAKVWNYAALI